MNWTTAIMESGDNQAQVKGTDMNELAVRGGILSYKSITVEYKYNFDCYSIPFLFFRSLPHGGSLILYSSHLDYLDPTLVDYLRPYLSVYPIRHPLWLSVSRDSQGITIQGFSPHKCGQKNSYSAFIAVVAAFP